MIMKSVRLAAMSLIAVFLSCSLFLTSPASPVSADPSAFGEYSCATFPDGTDAAIAYYTQYGGPDSLDADGDGLPCEANGDDYVTECADLPGPQSVAQDYYEANGMPFNLDLDQDGLACINASDGFFGDLPPRPASLPNEDEDEAPVENDTDFISSWDAYGVNCASFGSDQAAAQSWFDNHGQPWDIDLNDNGIACENESDGDFTAHPSAESTDDVDADSDSDSVATIKLPSTGAGSTAHDTMTMTAPIFALAALATLTLITAGTSIRLTRRCA